MLSALPSSPERSVSIQADLENVEQIRARIRKMTDRELRKYGRAAASMADPRKNRNPNPSFQVQLDEERAEQ